MSKKTAELSRRLAKRFRIRDGSGFRLKSFDPGDTRGLEDQGLARELLAEDVQKLARLQEKLYAQDRWSLLLIFQAMDAAGKDSAIKHVMSGVNPQGCEVTSFKPPSSEELDHDFLWRCLRCDAGTRPHRHLQPFLLRGGPGRPRPPRGARGAEDAPASSSGRTSGSERFEDIRCFERYLARNGVVIRKFFLHVSREEQRRRFLNRLDEPEKNWKFSMADVEERRHWDRYMAAYEDMIRHTATQHAPWYVVPADNKWFTRLVVAAAIVQTLESLDLAFPELTRAQKKELSRARAKLER